MCGRVERRGVVVVVVFAFSVNDIIDSHIEVIWNEDGTKDTRRHHSRILHQGPMLLSGLSLRKGSKTKCEPWWNTNTLINTTPVSDSWEWDSLIHFILIHKHTKLFHNETQVSTESTVHRIASCFDRVCFSSIFNTVTWFIFYFCCAVEPIFRCFCLIATKEQAKHHKKMNRKVIEVSRWYRKDCPGNGRSYTRN